MRQIECIDKAYTLSKRQHEKDDTDCIECLKIEVMKAKKLKNYGEALEKLEKLLVYKKEKFGQFNHECGMTYIMIGKVKFCSKQYDQSLAAYRKAVMILNKLLPEEHYGIGDLYYRIGTLYKVQNKYVEASRDLGKALEIFRKCFGKNVKHPKIKKCQQQISELNQAYLIQESGY